MYCNQLLFVVIRMVGGWLFVVISFNSISFLVDLKVKTTRNQFIFFKHPFSLFVWRFFLGFCQGQCAMPKIRLIIFAGWHKRLSKQPAEISYHKYIYNFYFAFFHLFYTLQLRLQHSAYPNSAGMLACFERFSAFY